MKRSHRLAIWAAFPILALAGCSHQRQEERHAEASTTATSQTSVGAHEEQHEQLDEHDVRDEAPVHRESASTDEQLGVVVEAPDGGVYVARVPKDRPLALPSGSKVTGSVPLERSSQNQIEDVGSVHTGKDLTAHKDSAAEAKGASSAALAAKSDEDLKIRTETSLGPPWWGWALGGAGVVVASVAVWKFRGALL